MIYLFTNLDSDTHYFYNDGIIYIHDISIKRYYMDTNYIDEFDGLSYTKRFDYTVPETLVLKDTTYTNDYVTAVSNSINEIIFNNI